MGSGTPLIIQDKTFVPDATAMATQDPTWNTAKWGGKGNLWTPHVYMPAQNPGDASGMSSFGRWMYGPWFWPPAKDAKYPPIPNPYFDVTCDPNVQPFCEPAQIPATPNVSVGMEAFNRVWESPETLPTRQEIRDPLAWVRRLHGPAAA